MPAFFCFFTHLITSASGFKMMMYFRAVLQNPEVKYISIGTMSKERYKIMRIVLTEDFLCLHLLFALIFILNTCIIGGQYINQTSHKPESYVA